MPYTLKPNKIFAKDPNGDGYLPQNVVSDATTAEQVAAVTSAGAQQVSAVQAKGAETLASIPSDYTTLSGDVSDLKSASDLNAFVANSGNYTIPVSAFEQGSWSYSTKSASTKRIRCKFLIPVSEGMVVTYTNPTLDIYIGRLATPTSGSYAKNGSWVTAQNNELTYTANGDGYLTIILRGQNNEDITPSDYDCTIVVKSNIGASVDNLGVIPLEWEQGRLTTSGEAATSDTIIRTPLLSIISVAPQDKFTLAVDSTDAINLFYYLDGVFVSYVNNATGSSSHFGTIEFVVPAGVNQLRLTLVANGSPAITPSHGDSVKMYKTTSAIATGISKLSGGTVHNATMRSFGNSIMTGALYPNGSLTHLCGYDDAPYGCVAASLGIEQSNVTHTLISSTGLLYDAGNGSFLDNIKATDLSGFDWLLTQFYSADLATYPLGSVESVADDGTLAGGVISLVNYIKASNGLCKLILVSAPPVNTTIKGANVFTGEYAGGSSIAELDDLMHKLANRHGFIYVDWQAMPLSYYYQDYTYNNNNVHAKDPQTYRTMGEYLGRCLTYARQDGQSFDLGVYNVEWEQGRYDSSGEEVSSGTYIRTVKPIIVTEGDKLSCCGTGTIVFNCYYYAATGSYLSNQTDVMGGTEVTVPENAAKLRISLRTSPTSNITPSYGSSVSVYDIDGDLLRIVKRKTEERLALNYRDCALIPNGTDYDTITIPGNYCSPIASEDIATMVNCPATTSHSMYVYSVASAYSVVQMLVAVGSVPTVYYRIKRNSASAFSEWLLISDNTSIESVLNTLGVCAITWEQGRYTVDGEKTSSDTNIRTAKRVNVTAGENLIPYMTGSVLTAYYYDSDDEFLSYTSDIKATVPFIVPESAKYMRLAFRKSPAEPITPDYGVNLKLYRADGYIMKPLYRPFNEPMLTIIDDDSNERFYNDLFGVFKNKNVPIATAVITGRVGNSGYMTWEQVEECYTSGIEVLSHTNRHFLSTDPDFETLTDDDITKDYLKAKNILGVHGVNARLLVFSGSTGLYEKFNTAAQHVYEGAFLAGANVTNTQHTDKYKIQRYRIGNQTDYHCELSVLQGLVDNVLETGGWMIWMTHTSGGTDAWTSGTGEGTSAYILGQAVDYARAHGLPVVTAEYGFRKYIEEK